MNDKWIERTGWVMCLGALAVVTATGLYAGIIESDVSVWKKVVVSVGYLGLAALFLVVVREHLIERKTDKYKDMDVYGQIREKEEE